MKSKRLQIHILSVLTLVLALGGAAFLNFRDTIENFPLGAFGWPLPGYVPGWLDTPSELSVPFLAADILLAIFVPVLLAFGCEKLIRRANPFDGGGG